MKRYKISLFGGDEQLSVVMDLRPTELKTVERVSELLLARLVEVGNTPNTPFMDIEEV